MVLKCGACGHEAATKEAVRLEDAIFRCDECGARIVYGALVPRVVVEPFAHPVNGQPMTRVRFQDPTTHADVFTFESDPQFAAMIAKNILSVVLP